MLNADSQNYIHIDKPNLIFYHDFHCKERKYVNEPCIMTKPMFDEIMDYVCLLCWEKKGHSFTFRLNVKITDLFYKVKTLFSGSKYVFVGKESTQTADGDQYLVPNGITIEYHYMENNISFNDNNWKYNNLHRVYEQRINRIQVITINVASEYSEMIYRDIQSFADRVLQNKDILYKIKDSLLKDYESGITVEINGKMATGHSFFVDKSGIFAYPKDGKNYNSSIRHIISFKQLKRMELQSIVERLGFIIALGNYHQYKYTIKIPGIREYGDDVEYRPNLIYEYYYDFKDIESLKIKNW